MRRLVILTVFGLSACPAPAPVEEDEPVAEDAASEAPDVPSRPPPDLGPPPPPVDVAVADPGPPPSYCPAGSLRCLADFIAQTCSADGSHWNDTLCAEGERCFEGRCGKVICEPNAALAACAKPRATALCNAGGTGILAVPCPALETCYQGTCVDWRCAPGAVACRSMKAVHKCNDDGSGFTVIDTCAPGEACQDGACVAACQVALASGSSLGCSHVAVALDLTSGVTPKAAVLVASVPEGGADATVQVNDLATGAALSVPVVVAPGTPRVVALPPGTAPGGSGLSAGAVQVLSTSPISLAQLGPYGGEGGDAQDGSLVLPTAFLGTEYIAIGWPARVEGATSRRGYVSVAALVETVVSVTPRAAVAAGPPGSGVLALSAGQTLTVTVPAGQVLTLVAAAVAGADLTGTRVVADHPVAVFAGHECANVPVATPACNHLEEQLLPISAWGHAAVAAPFAPRTEPQVDLWRVIGGAEGVTVATDPPQPGYAAFQLSKGAFVTIGGAAPFRVTADGPVQVVHYLTGATYPGHGPECGGVGLGDPAMAMEPPVDRYTSHTVTVTPPGYAAGYLNVVAPVDATVTVDGIPIPEVAPIGASTYGLAIVPVQAGAHTIVASAKVGVTAYGYGCGSSYAWSAGLRVLPK